MVTVTLTAPAEPAGVVAVRVVLLTKLTLLPELLPKATVAPEEKFVPVMVTAVPPAVGPELGDTELTVGAVLEDDPGRKATICMSQVEEPA